MKEFTPKNESEQLVSDFSIFLSNHFKIGNISFTRSLAEVVDEFIKDDARAELVSKIATQEDVQRAFNAVGELYGKTRNVESQEKILKWMLDCGINNARTLSVGCGPAQTEIFLASKGIIREEIVGLDFAENLLTLGKELARKEDVKNVIFENKPASEIKFQDEFEQVFFIDSLHWMDNWRNCLQKAAKALRNEGTMFVYCEGEKGRANISHFEAIKTLAQSGLDIVKADELRIGDFIPKIAIFAKKQSSDNRKLIIPGFVASTH
jgi:ubiquinone/menaquinone biosynthesis C-methylase UbiE